MKKPLNIAHRGGGGLRPENTLAAFAHALDLGVDGFELDVHVAKDGSVVVFHDDRLKHEIARDSNGAWIEKPGPLIKDLTLADLHAYDIGRLLPGSAYAKRYPDYVPCDGEHIPRLADVIFLMKRQGGNERLWIELKTNFLDRSQTASPQEMAEAVVRVLKREKFLDRAVLVGFDWPALIAAKALEPKLVCWFTTLPQSWFRERLPPKEDGPPPKAELEALRAMERDAAPWTGGFDRHKYGGSVIKAAKAGGADGWFPYYADVTADTVSEARDEGLAIGAWTVNAVSDIKRLAELGVDGLCTDYPDRLKSATAKRK